MTSVMAGSKYFAAEVSPPLWVNLNGSMKSILIISLLLSFPFFINYAIGFGLYHWHHRHTKKPQLPPEYPSFIPFINILFLAFDGKNFLERITTYRGRLTSARLSVLGKNIYFFQEREVIARLWKSSDLSSPIISYIFALKYFCGMSKKALLVYETDDSGPFPKPYPGSTVQPRNRVDYLIHQNMQRGLAGPGLLPTTKRFADVVTRRIHEVPVSNEWIEMPDFSRFIYDIVGVSIMEAVCGPSLLELNPAFANDFWNYDKNVPWLARALPHFIIPNAYRTQKRLLYQLKNWYAYARSHFSTSSIDEDGNGDPFWGSEMMRSRQEFLLQVDGQDDDSLASSDLGLIWASVSNILGASTWATMHIFKDKKLLRCVRESVKGSSDLTQGEEYDPKKLDKLPLLSSIYAETLRLYAKSYTIACSPHSDIQLGSWWLPRGEIGLVNSHNAHTDATYWNTKGGLHPVDKFWADRFIYDPNDPSTGPVKPEFRNIRKTEDSRPFFSLEGLDSTWIPYGGGYKKCPGRFLAKSAVILTCTLISEKFDIEILSDSLEMNPWKFGMGILRPKSVLPFKVRRRI